MVWAFSIMVVVVTVLFNHYSTSNSRHLHVHGNELKRCDAACADVAEKAVKGVKGGPGAPQTKPGHVGNVAQLRDACEWCAVIETTSQCNVACLWTTKKTTKNR